MTVSLLRVRDLTVRYPGRGLDGRRVWVNAVNEVGFDIKPGETLGLVGESGSGKTTIARALTGLAEAHNGQVALDGTDLLALRGRALRGMRKRIQMVFQDPYSSLNPSMVVGDSIGEPLQIHMGLGRQDRNRRVAELLEMVGLQPFHMSRYPYEFSGGQRQRIAIARALAAGPDLLILDEPVSALDVSTQNRILVLLESLQQQLGLAYLFISHDLLVVRHISKQVMILYLGRDVEHGPTEQIFDEPTHPYTKALLSAVPVPDPHVQRSRARIVLKGEPPDPANPPAGCPFHTRCVQVAEICLSQSPPMQQVGNLGETSCHLPWRTPKNEAASH